MRGALLTLIVVLIALWGLVTWLQPQMAFFPWTGIQRTPAAFEIPYRDVELVTADKVTLHAWWMEHPAPRGQVVYWHGNGGNLALWLEVLADVRTHGFNVFAVDYRGYGASEGSPTEQGLYRDADAAIEHYVKHLRRDDLPTIYWGRSLGCAVASYSAGQAAPDAMILESPFADVRSLFARNPVMTVLALFATYRFPTARHLETYEGPLLVIHGDADSIIPFRAGRQVYERAATSRKTFVALKGADHNDVHGQHPGYWHEVDRFLGAIKADQVRRSAPERLHRIDAHGPPGRDEARDERSREQQQRDGR